MSLKSDLIAAAAIPTGKSDFAGQEVDIRGLTAAEEILYSEDGFKGFVKNAIPICAACIVDNGKPVFEVKDLTGIKSGVLKAVLMDIINISYPDAKVTEKN